MPKKKKSKIPTITEEEYEKYILFLKETEASQEQNKNGQSTLPTK